MGRVAGACLASLLLAGAVIALAGCSGGPGGSPEPAALPELPFARELQGALEGALEAGRGGHDLGISAAVIVPGHAPWSGVAGNSRPGEPVTPDMLFEAGSVAKSFEAALALRLAEEGLLDLDAPLSTWLPAYRNVAPEATVRQLLNHTSGVFNVFEHPDFPWVGPEVVPERRWRREEVFDSFVLDPYGPPGHAQHYASTNFLLLTAILEEVTGASVPSEVERRLLRPLGLEHTFMSMGELPPPRFSVAHPWLDMDKDGDLDDLSGTPRTWIATSTHPLIFTTPGDLARWMQALYHHQSVLSAGSLKEMLTYPETALADPEGGRYGLGVVDFTEILGIEAIGHGGSSPGYSAGALYLTDYGTALTWLVNTGEGPPDLAGRIMGKTWSSLSEVLQAHLKPLS